jgi:ABC-type microcin C transport system permease subunit YejB
MFAISPSQISSNGSLTFVRRFTVISLVKSCLSVSVTTAMSVLISATLVSKNSGIRSKHRASENVIT